jgi:RNA polymerase sigma factor (sigma-70 family)
MKDAPDTAPPVLTRPPVTTDDAQLLRRYVEERSQDAFTELVRRHVNLVYFAALRRVGGDSHLADDVAQTVFGDLARKAPSLRGRAMLTGWLYTSTRFAAAQAVRSEQRRRTHEQEAQTMRELQLTPDPDWNQLRPIIDDALDELSEHEREAVLLRFFENRPLAEVGTRFSLSADAARMRVERALEKLRGLLAKRGIVSTSAALATAFAAQSGLAAPASLVARIVASVGGQVGSATAATVALWKIFVGVGVVGALGIGIVAYETSTTKQVPAVVVAATVTRENAAAAAPPPPQPIAMETTVSDSPTAEAGPLVTVSPFDALSERQKAILKRLWEHHKLFPTASSAPWSFRPGLAAAAQVVADFETAAGALQAKGLVGIHPETETVFLTNEGGAFCQAHAAEINAFQSKTAAYDVPMRFSALSTAEKDILKTLWEHQKISPDHPPIRWGFKVAPESADFAAFEDAVAGLREVNGLVGVGAQTGVVYLTDPGMAFCLAHASEFDAYPAPAREFRRMSPEQKTPVTVP